MTHIPFENIKEVAINLAEPVDQVTSDTLLLTREILPNECSGLLKRDDCGWETGIRVPFQTRLVSATHGSHILSRGAECNPSCIMSLE